MMAYGSPSARGIGVILYGLTTSGGMIGLITSMVGGVFAAVLGLLIGVSGEQAVWVGLGGGVLGTFHHLYFSGTPVGVIALGSVFSALEVVPLLVVGFEAYSRAKHEGLHDWQKAYRWPLTTSGGTGLPSSVLSAGLESNRSSWLGAPAMNR